VLPASMMTAKFQPTDVCRDTEQRLNPEFELRLKS
jgi:hypothetical protein